MKNLKISLTLIIFAIIATLTTGVFAYTGEGDVDPDYSIKLSSSLTNGVGTVSGASDFTYQFVEISEAKYNTIKKLEAEFDLIQVYVEWTQDRDNESKANAWETAQEKYASKYGNGAEAAAVATEVLNKYGLGPDILTVCRNAWIAELTDFDSSKWIQAEGNKMTLDLTTFTGTKYFIGWINTGSVYDAEAYVAVGTGNKEEENKNNLINNQTDTPSTKNEITENNTPKAITTNKSTASSLPYTGASDVVLVLIAVAVVAAGVAYVKYRKIK